ncbi:MAG: hypothetical protein FD143_2832 [Ignavibacteria bacterium]|nr:MAG: hypothetical protein FD143_2832 [Ignavibacteria bacterium]
MTIKHYANIDEKGKLLLANRESFYNEIKQMANRRVYLTVSEERPTRTNEQLRYWFGVVLKMIVDYILETQGQNVSVEDMHEYYVQKGYFGLESKMINGEIIIIHNRSKKVNTKQFAEVVEKVKMEWAERGLVIPDSNEINY